MATSGEQLAGFWYNGICQDPANLGVDQLVTADNCGTTLKQPDFCY